MPLSPLDEQGCAQLMRLAQQGDKTAYNQLLDAIARRLKAFFQKRLGTQGEADDLVQETLISIHASRHTYDPQRLFTPWMYAIARYRLADYWRRQITRLKNEVSELTDQPEPTGGAMHEEVVTALDALPDKQRRVIHMIKVDGYSIRETALALEMSEAATKVTAHRAYKALRKRFMEITDANE